MLLCGLMRGLCVLLVGCLVFDCRLIFLFVWFVDFVICAVDWFGVLVFGV